jgi:alpha-D-xyloside xylohydrolase
MIMVAALGGCAFYGVIAAVAIPVTSVTKDASGVTFAMTPGSMRIDVCADGILRVRYSLQGTIPVDANMGFLVKKTWTPPAFTQTETTTDVVIATAKVQVKVNKATGAVTFLDLGGAPILQETSGGGKSLTAGTVNGESTYTCEQSFDSPADEAIYGLGSMHDGFVNFHGMPEYLVQNNTHISIPVILSNKGYGILWANASRTYFNLPDQRITGGSFTTTTAGDYVFLMVDGSTQSDISITVNGTVLNSLSNTWHSASLSGKINLGANKTVTASNAGGGALYGGLMKNSTKFTSKSGQTVDYYFFHGPDPDDVIAGYRTATGTVPLFSKGTYGFIQSKERYTTQAQILDIAHQFRTRSIPIDMIVQDWQYWSEGWGAMQFDPSRFPAPKTMIDSVHKMDMKFMISVWSNPQAGAVNTALTSQNLKISGTPFFDAFNPQGRSVYWSYQKSTFFDIGSDAFWQDSDEPEGTNLENFKVNFGSGAIGGKSYANAYPLHVCMTVHDGWRAASSAKRVCILTRSAFAGSQRYGTINWNGDIAGNWEWFKRSVPAGLNFCMAGLPYWTTDIGGFFRPANQLADDGYNELYSRWVEFGTFCPIFRVHGSAGTTEIWNFPAATQTVFKTYDDLRYRLLPYTYSLAGMVTNNGYTMLRGLIMDFRTDAAVNNITDQFMFGPAFLVNPVLSAGLNSRNVYLPTGATWRNFWTGQTTTGGQTVSARAPRDTIPVFVRSGSIIPMGPFLQYANQKKADTIELRVYPGANGSFTMYEDEGENYNYEAGKSATIPITYIDNPQNVIIGDRIGSFTGMEGKVFNIVYVSPNHGTGVAKTAQSDCQLVYTGTKVSCSPVGVQSKVSGAAAMVPAECTLKSAGNMVVLPIAFMGKAKTITVYDCSGKVLHKAVVKKNTVDVRRDFGLSAGVYIVKAGIVR